MTQNTLTRSASRTPASTKRSARVLEHFAGSVAIFAVVLGSWSGPVQAQVVSATGTTTVTTAGTVSDVTTTNIRNGVAFNDFSSFNVNAGTTVNLYRPPTSSALVNLISNAGGPSTIAGTVNIGADFGSGFTTSGSGPAYLLNSDGFMVTSTGVINAGQLTLSTPTGAFMTQLRNEASGGPAVSGTLFAGAEPLSNTGVIEMHGQINANRVDMRAGQRMIMDGRITVDLSLIHI